MDESPLAPPRTDPSDQPAQANTRLVIKLHKLQDGHDIHLEGLAQQALLGGLVGTVHGTRPIGQDQLVVLRTKGDGALEVARIGSAAHGKRLGIAARDAVVDVDQGLHLRRGRVDGEGRLGARGLDRAAVAKGNLAAALGQLVRIDAVREPHIDSLLDAAVVAPDERHTIIVTHDVTERRRVDDMRRDFVANVSHELRTPLTVIAGFLDLADMDVPPELRKRHLALMRDQTARMKRLTDDLLMLSKLENRDERGTDQPELIDMSALIDDAVREGMAYSKMQHKFEVAHEPLSLLGHPEEIRSAVLNLITNAVRYTPRGGRIRVVWKRTGTGAVLTVADTGIGIPPEHLPRITERFYRVDKGRSRDTGGTGLGLAIVKHVMRRAGGELSIESTPGEGSKFMLRFPEERIFSGRYL